MSQPTELAYEAFKALIDKTMDISVGLVEEGLQRSENIAILYAQHVAVVLCIHIGVLPGDVVEKTIGNAIVAAVKKHYGFEPAFEKAKQGEIPKSYLTGMLKIVPLDK